jgi:hypothetical protein
MTTSSPTTVSLFFANVLPSHDLYGSVVAADGLATTYNIQCFPGPDFSAPSTTTESIEDVSADTLLPPTVTDAFCALPQNGEIVVNSGNVYGGTEDWGDMKNTWRCTISENASCVQSSADVGLTYTIPSATSLMKSVTVTGGAEKLSQTSSSGPGETGRITVSNASVGSSVKTSRADGGRERYRALHVFIWVALIVSLIQGTSVMQEAL